MSKAGIISRRLFVALPALLAPLGGASCSAGVYDDEAANVPLDLTGPRPTAQLRIGENPAVTAIFDTGAAASVVRRGYADQIHMPDEGPAQASGPNGTPIQGYRTTIAEGRLGDAHFSNALAVALEIPLPLPGIDAVISPAVFAGRLVRINFAANVAEILPKTDANIPTGQSDAYTGENGHGRIRRVPSVRVELPGGEIVRAMGDTGAAAGLRLPINMADSLPFAGPLTPRDPVRRIGSTLPAHTAQLQGSVRVGPIVLENPEIVFVEGEYEPLVGADVLRQGVFVLDPEEFRSWLLPAA